MLHWTLCKSLLYFHFIATLTFPLCHQAHHKVFTSSAPPPHIDCFMCPMSNYPSCNNPIFMLAIESTCALYTNSSLYGCWLYASLIVSMSLSGEQLAHFSHPRIHTCFFGSGFMIISKFSDVEWVHGTNVKDKPSNISLPCCSLI